MPVCYPLDDSGHEATGNEGHISADAGFCRAWIREKFDISQALLQRIGVDLYLDQQNIGRIIERSNSPKAPVI